jgi:hypothetical protein
MKSSHILTKSASMEENLLQSPKITRIYKGKFSIYNLRNSQPSKKYGDQTAGLWLQAPRFLNHSHI